MSACAAGHGSIGTDAFHSPTAPPLPPRGNPRRTAGGALRLLASPGSTIQGTTFDELPADRVRTCRQQVAGVSEKKISGGLAFLPVAT